MATVSAALEELRRRGLPRLVRELEREGFRTVASGEHDVEGDAPLMVRPLDGHEARISFVNYVRRTPGRAAYWVMSIFVGWTDETVEQVWRDATAQVGPPREERRWASIIAPLGGLGPGGNLRVNAAWEMRDVEGFDARLAELRHTLASDLPVWLARFSDVDGVVAYAKQWPVLGDVGHQLTGLIVSCLERRTDDVEYFARFIFRRTARAMLRRSGYEAKAAQYRAIGQVTGVEVPVPTLEQVQAWADEQERTRRY